MCHGEGEPSTYRMESSAVDYDGDGDIEEGVAEELAGLKDALYSAIQVYAADVAGTPIAYSCAAYPYFFIDTNADGEAGDDEANYGNKYASWTPRLLQAAYNLQVAKKDPGAFAHGSCFTIRLRIWMQQRSRVCSAMITATSRVRRKHSATGMRMARFQEAVPAATLQKDCLCI
jgi:hypothetical protein